jgi:hypothetical protein
MRTGFVAALALLVAVVRPAGAGELERLRAENARLQERVRQLEAENAALRSPTASGDRGLVAALTERATEAVVESPGPRPGTSRVETEPSRLAGLGSGKSRHWLIWRGERLAGGGRAEAASMIVDSVDSGGVYRDVKVIALVVDGQPVDVPVADYRMQINTTGRGTGARQRGESVTARVPTDVLDRLAGAASVSGRVGSTPFRLTPQQLADVREFAKRLGG